MFEKNKVYRIQFDRITEPYKTQLINLAKRVVQWFGPNEFLRKFYDVPPVDEKGVLLAGKYGTPDARMDLTPSLWLQHGGRERFCEWLCFGDRVTHSGIYIFDSDPAQTQDLEFEEAVRLINTQKRNLVDKTRNTWHKDRCIDVMMQQLPIRRSVLRESAASSKTPTVARNRCRERF